MGKAAQARVSMWTKFDTISTSMLPDEQQPGGVVQPTPPQPPQPLPQPQHGYEAAPLQHASGQYEVVPPLPTAGNNGHSGHNPYEFIVSAKAVKHKRQLLSTSSFMIRIGIILAGMVVLIVLLVVGASLLSPKSSNAGLTTIAQRQQEIMRVSKAAGQNATGQDTQNFVANVNAAVTSSQQQLITYLQSHGTKLTPKILALDQSTQTDTLLSSAASVNNYDSAVAQNLSAQLKTYESLLRTTYQATSNKQTKLLLQDCFTSADKLIAQGKALPQSNN